MQVLSDDEVTQRKGAVLIFASEPNKLGDYSPEKKQIVHSIYACQSIRWSAFHICLPSHPLFQALKGILLLAVGKELRAKARNHDGEFARTHKYLPYLISTHSSSAILYLGDSPRKKAIILIISNNCTIPQDRH